MKNLHLIYSVTIFCAICFIGACLDQYEPLPPSIEGHWRKLVPAHPPTEYDFRAGILTQTISFAGQPVAEIQRTYAMRLDTLLIGGDLGDPQRRYVLRFIGGEVVEVRPVSADTLALGGMAYWERL